MGLLTLTVAGSGFILIGVWESLTSTGTVATGRGQRDTATNPNSLPSSPVSIPKSSLTRTTQNPDSKIQSFSSFTYIAIAIFSFLFIINSLVSVFDANNSNDRVGSALQLQILGIAALFTLYSVLGIVTNSSSSTVLYPSPLLNLIALFGFVEEFLLFYLQRKDTSGVENRYFDLMLVPISICVISTVIELKSSSKSNNHARLARGIGLILQGTWFMQMGISFYTSLIVHGCFLREKSRGNYTIKCKGHPEYHRGRGIATLQFNCHLALLVIVLAAVYSIIAKRNGYAADNFTMYKPLGAEMQQIENIGHFTLDSDEDLIREEEDVAKENGAIVAMGVNGHGSHE